MKRTILLGLLVFGQALTSHAMEASQTAASAPSSGAGAVPQLIVSARMWSNKYRNDLALQMIQKALLVSPNDPAALSELGQIEIRSNQLDEASHQLFRLQTLYPNAEGTRELGYAYLVATTGKQELATITILSRNKQTAQAVQRLQALFSKGPPTGDLAAAYYSILGNDPPHRAEAILALRHVIANDPNNLNAAISLVLLLGRDTATLPESIQLAQQVASNPDVDRPAALDAWRRVLRDTGANPAYIDAQQAYVDAAPDDIEFKNMLAASRAMLAARLKLESDPAWQAQQQGMKLLDKGALTEADPLLMKALASRGNDADLLGALGLLRMREGRHMETWRGPPCSGAR